MRSKYLSLIKDTLLFAIGSIGSKLILFVMMPIYTNYLTEAEYGISDLVFSSSQLLIPFLGLVIHDAVVRFGLSKEEKKENVLLVGLLVFAVGSVLTVAITPLFGLYDALAEWKWYMCIYIILNMLCSVQGCYIKSVDQNKLYAVVNIVQTFAMAALNVILIVWRGMGIKGYLLSTILASAVAAVIFFVCGNMAKELREARFDPGLLKRMVVFSAPLILNNVSWWAIHSSSKVLVELMVGAAALGIYTVAAKIPSLINVIISIFSQAWNISSAREVEGEGDSGFYSGIFTLYQTLVFGAVIVLNGIIKPFMGIYVGDAFVSSWRYIPLLLAAAGFSAISAYFVSLYAALKKSINNMVTTLMAAVLNVVLGFALIRALGIWGAVIATLVAYLLLAAMRMIDLNRYIEIRIPKGRYIFNCVLILLQSVLVSLDHWIYLCSGIVLALYVAVNISPFLAALKAMGKKENG